MITNLVCFPQCEVFALFFSPRGTVLVGAALAPNGDVLAKFWVTAGWREMNLQDIALKDVCHGAFSPDERVVALAYFVTGTAVWWDLKTGRRLHVFEYGSTGGAQAAFSPDGRWFATGGLDGALTVWDTATRSPRSIGRGYRNGLQALVFSPDSRRLVASGVSPKGLIKVWDVETGRDVATLPGEPGRFSRLGFSPDGNSLFAASTEGTGLLWHAPSFAEIETTEKNERTP